MKVDESELPGYPRRFHITKKDIQRFWFSDGCVGCNAMRQGKTVQRHSEYCRRREQEDLKSTEEGRGKLEKAEERFTEALVQAGERMERLGIRAAMNLGETIELRLQHRQGIVRSPEFQARAA